MNKFYNNNNKKRSSAAAASSKMMIFFFPLFSSLFVRTLFESLKHCARKFEPTIEQILKSNFCNLGFELLQHLFQVSGEVRANRSADEQDVRACELQYRSRVATPLMQLQQATAPVGSVHA